MTNPVFLPSLPFPSFLPVKMGVAQCSEGLFAVRLQIDQSAAPALLELGSGPALAPPQGIADY